MCRDLFFLHYPLTKPILAFALGILWARFFPVSVPIWPYAVIMLLLLISEWQRTKRSLTRSRIFVPIVLVLFVLLGYLNYQWRQPEFQPHHYIRQVKGAHGPQLLQVKITDVLKPNSYQERYVVRCVALNGAKCKGSLLLQKAIEAPNNFWKIDDVLVLKTPLRPLPIPKNPGAFDYAAYLQNQGVYAILEPTAAEVLGCYPGNQTLKGRASAFRSMLLSKLSKSGIAPRERSIVQALVLGEKRSISPSLYSGYANAGALHILAVSGLHVGILYVLFATLLFPLNHLRFGKQIKTLLLICLLWGVAFMTGLSSSVIRAVVMFSLFAVARLLGRSTHTIIVLFLAFFVMLIYNPRYLFSVGFQMSYLAVFFIVFGQPLLQGLVRTNHKMLRKMWVFITVTLTAQLGVMPISLYYFHTFPGLFLITNIVVLPLISVLLVVGLLSVIWSAFAPLPERMSSLITMLFEQLNNFILWVARQEAFIFRDISFGIWEVVLLYGCIVSGLLLISGFSFRKVLRFGTFAGLFLIALNVLSYHSSTRSEWLVFQRYKESLIAFRNGNKLHYMSFDSLSKTATNRLKEYRIAYRIKRQQSVPRQYYFSVQGKFVLIVDSLAQYKIEAPVAVVVLTQSPKLHLNRLIEQLQPQLIIADGSNYPSYVKRWKATCRREQVRFHDTRTQGAFRSP